MNERNSISTNNVAQNDTLKKEQENSSKQVNNTSKKTEKTVVTRITPSGFMGSSSYEVILYSNKEVYVVQKGVDDSGREGTASEKLIAEDVDEIIKNENSKSDTYGGVIVKGGEKLSSEYAWISFE